MTTVIDGTSGSSIAGNATITGNLTVTSAATVGSLQVTGAATAASLQVGGVTTNLYPLVSGTAQNSTSGTSIDFANVIPSWAKRVTVMFNGVSTTGTSNVIIQLGYGATPTFVNTGYAGSCVNFGGANQTAFSTGFMVVTNSAAGNINNGVSTLSLFGSNVWAMQSVLGRGDAGNNGTTGAGTVSVGNQLTSIRVTTVGGTDTFDLGSINIMWE